MGWRALVCTGRPVNRLTNQPTGQPCAAGFSGPDESARVLGWRIGPARPDGTHPAMCPDCARPGAGEQPTDQPADLEPLPGL